MTDLYDSSRVHRSTAEWLELLRSLLGDLAVHLKGDLVECAHFIEEQAGNELSHGCHLDFRFRVSPQIKLDLCGILCYSVSWGEAVSIGAYLIPFQDTKRLHHQGDDDTVIYLAREPEGWMPPIVDHGHGDEWNRYGTDARWSDEPAGANKAA